MGKRILLEVVVRECAELSFSALILVPAVGCLQLEGDDFEDPWLATGRV